MTPAKVVLWIALVGGSSGVAETCADLASDLNERLESTKMAMEPESVLATVYQRATEAGARCPDNESLAYLRLRSAELGRGTAVGRQPESARNEWRALARDPSARFPKSVRMKGRDIKLIEPDGRDPRPVSGAHEILGLVYLARRDFAKAALHLKLASVDSEKARMILENPPRGLKAAMR